MNNQTPDWAKDSDPIPDWAKDVSSDRSAPETKRPRSSALGATTDVLNRSIVAGTLGAPVDISAQLLRGFPFNVDVGQAPVGGSEWIGKQMERAGMVSPTRRPVAETVTAFAPAVLGAGAVGAGKLARKATDLTSRAIGKESKALSEGRRTQMGGTAQDVIRRAEQSQVAPEKSAKAIAKSQEQLGKREPIASARQAAREADVQKSLQVISPEKNVLAEDVGSVIQPIGQQNIQRLKTIREQQAIKEFKDPVFVSSRQREQAGDFISTNPKSAKLYQEIVDEIQKQISRTPEAYQNQLKARFSALQGREIPLTSAEKRAAELRASITGESVPTTKTAPITMDEAEFMRRMLRDKDMSKVEGFQALDAGRMNDLGKKLAAAMNEYDPRFGQYLSKYKETSEPITRATVGRAGRLTDVELAAEEAALFSADKKAAANYFLDGTQEKAQRLIELLGGKNPQVVNKIKGYFRNEIEGMNSKQVMDFVRKQEGFLREFPELRKPLLDAADSKRIVETLGVTAEKKAGQAATRLSGQAKQAEEAIGTAEKTAEKYRITLSRLETGSKEEVAKNAKKIANDLRSDRIIDDEKYKELLNKIEQVEKSAADVEAARKQISYLAASAVIPVLGVTGYYKLKATLGF